MQRGCLAGEEGLLPSEKIQTVLKYGILIAALLIGLLALMAFPNRIVAAIAMVVWVGLLYGLFSWNRKRRKSSPPSRF
jgi:apolipoprotein N-acyltransferase